MKALFGLSLIAAAAVTDALGVPPASLDRRSPPVEPTPGRRTHRRGIGVQSDLYVDPETCTGSQFMAASEAINGAHLLALSGIRALLPSVVDLPHNPAPYFFRPDDYEIVREVLSLFVDYSQSQGKNEPIRVSCHDSQSGCNDGHSTLAFVESDETDIILCPRFFSKPQLGLSCSGALSKDGLTGIGGTTQAQILLHEFTHASHSIEPTVIDDYAYGTHKCHQLLQYQTTHPDSLEGPTYNADSYARFASWAYDLGLLSAIHSTSERPSPPNSCLGWFQPDANPAIGEFPKDPWEAPRTLVYRRR